MRCDHASAVPVESIVTGEVLAALCPACDRQLPAEFWHATAMGPVERARYRLDQVNADPEATDLDRREAHLAYRQALFSTEGAVPTVADTNAPRHAELTSWPGAMF